MATQKVSSRQITAGGGAITSVFGRTTAAIIATIGDYTTDQVTEGTLKYFTNARALAATLTAYSSSAGTISSTDTILQAIQKLNGNDGLLAPLASPTFTGTVTLPAGTVINATLTGYTSGAGIVAGTDSILQAIQKLNGNDALKATLASPTFTGTVTLPAGTVINSPITGYVSGAGVVAATDSLLQAIQKLNGNAALFAPLASPTFTGTPTLPTGSIGTTQTAGNSTTALATTAFVTTADNLKAPLASPTFTGTVVFPAGTVINSPITGYVSGSGTVAATDSLLQAIQKLNGNAALLAPLASPTFTGTVTLPAGTVINSALTGYVSGAGVVAATDSILAAIQKLNGNIAALAFPAVVDKQEFAAGGTWTKPANAKWVFVRLWGGGGGGGAGRRGAAASARVAGGGGGGGGYSEFQMDPATLTSTLTIILGAAGTGAVAITADNTDGGSGGAGGDTSFGGVLRALGGAGGTGGAGGFGGGGGAGGGGATYLGSGGAGANTGGGDGNDVGDQTSPGPTGGGSGGGINASDTEGGYGHSAGLFFYTNPRDNYTPGFFTSDGHAGVQMAGLNHGSGANGGAGKKTVAATAGGAGASYGGGGGGGGASLNGFNSGAGGAGGIGHATIITYF